MRADCQGSISSHALMSAETSVAERQHGTLAHMMQDSKTIWTLRELQLELHCTYVHVVQWHMVRCGAEMQATSWSLDIFRITDYKTCRARAVIVRRLCDTIKAIMSTMGLTGCNTLRLRSWNSKDYSTAVTVLITRDMLSRLTDLLGDLLGERDLNW